MLTVLPGLEHGPPPSRNRERSFAQLALCGSDAIRRLQGQRDQLHRSFGTFASRNDAMGRRGRSIQPALDDLTTGFQRHRCVSEQVQERARRTDQSPSVARGNQRQWRNRSVAGPWFHAHFGLRRCVQGSAISVHDCGLPIGRVRPDQRQRSYAERPSGGNLDQPWSQ